MTNKHFCEDCSIYQPIRAHHCWLCNSCISSRDHHCFFMGTCIGETNQKYFIVYCFYQFLAGLYFIILMTLYLYKVYQFKFNLLSFTLLPIILMFKLVTQPWNTDLHFCYCVFLMYITLVAMIASITFFMCQLYLVVQGLTSYESRTTGIPQVQPDISISNRISEVFPGGEAKYFIFPFK